MLVFRSYHQLFTDFVARQATQWRGKRILDLGCGSGRLSVFFAKHNTVTGIDVQNNVRGAHANFTFHQLDAEALPFADNCFDVVVSFDVIEHVEGDLRFMKETSRVLKPGGHLLLGTPNKDRFSHQLRHLIGRSVRYPLYLGVDPVMGLLVHLREYTAADLRQLAGKAGFQDVEVMPFWFGLPPVSVGLQPVPAGLNRYCQYWFVEAKKASE